jgi:hypothetical protein
MVAVGLGAADVRPVWWILMIVAIVIALVSWLVDAARANKGR